MMELQNILTDNSLRSKVKHIIDNSLSMLERKMSNINNELNTLKNEYQEEISKCIFLLNQYMIFF
jgi:hypothetical protein